MYAKSAVLGLVMALMLNGGPAARADSPQPTTITVPSLDCANCAKPALTAVRKVDGVSKAEFDVKTKTIKVLPKSKSSPSPKSLWEALEKIDKTPTKLAGPNGVFTSKPDA